ncbi:putative holin [Escherichia coli]|uniref:putative holin n=1 Tax=Escherichia coli TaxID=562 RepID=UPI00288A06B6|nr:putative holin [Escherichia coli]
MSEPLSGSGTAAALGGATVFGLFTGTDFGIVFGAFAGALFVATIPQQISVWRVAAHFLVSFIVGVLGADVMASSLRGNLPFLPPGNLSRVGWGFLPHNTASTRKSGMKLAPFCNR